MGEAGRFNSPVGRSSGTSVQSTQSLQETESQIESYGNQEMIRVQAGEEATHENTQEALLRARDIYNTDEYQSLPGLSQAISSVPSNKELIEDLVREPGIRLHNSEKIEPWKIEMDPAKVRFSITPDTRAAKILEVSDKTGTKVKAQTGQSGKIDQNLVLDLAHRLIPGFERMPKARKALFWEWLEGTNPNNTKPKRDYLDQINFLLSRSNPQQGLSLDPELMDPSAAFERELDNKKGSSEERAKARETFQNNIANKSETEQWNAVMQIRTMDLGVFNRLNNASSGGKDSWETTQALAENFDPDTAMVVNIADGIRIRSAKRNEKVQVLSSMVEAIENDLDEGQSAIAQAGSYTNFAENNPHLSKEQMMPIAYAQQDALKQTVSDYEKQIQSVRDEKKYLSEAKNAYTQMKTTLGDQFNPDNLYGLPDDMQRISQGEIDSAEANLTALKMIKGQIEADETQLQEMKQKKAELEEQFNALSASSSGSNKLKAEQTKKEIDSLNSKIKFTEEQLANAGNIDEAISNAEQNLESLKQQSASYQQFIADHPDYDSQANEFSTSMSKLQNIPSDPKDSWDAAQSLGKGTKQFSDRMQILNDSINDLKKKQKIAQKEFESLEDIGHYQARFEEIKDLGNALQKEDAEFLQAYQDGNAKKMQALAPGFEPVLTDLGHEVWEKRSPFGQFNKEFDKGAATYDKFLKVGKSTQDLVNSLTPEPDDREFGDRGGKAVKDLNDLRTNGAIASLKERMNKSVSGTIKDFVENNIKPLLGDPEKRSVHAKNMDEHIKKIMEKGTAAERREARKTGFLGQTANTELAQKEADKNKAESEEEKAWFQESTELWRMKKSQERIV